MIPWQVLGGPQMLLSFGSSDPSNQLAALVLYQSM